MGEKVVAGGFDLSDRQRYRRKLHECLEGLERLLAEKRFDRPKNMMGLEIELNLAGADGLPRMVNAQVLERIASPDFQTELGMFNLEVNVLPHRLGGRVFDQLAEELSAGLAYAHRQAAEIDSRRRDDRYSADDLARRPGHRESFGRGPLFAAERADPDDAGEDFTLDIDGVERLIWSSGSIVPEAACTSVQLHLQVTAGAVLGRVERGAGGERRTDSRRRQLAVPVRARAVAGIAAAVVHPGHRHPAARAPGAGGTAADLVRGAVGGLRVRALRGERPLLPLPAAHL